MALQTETGLAALETVFKGGVQTYPVTKLTPAQLKALQQLLEREPPLEPLPVVTVRCDREKMLWEISTQGHGFFYVKQAVLTNVTFEAAHKGETRYVSGCGYSSEEPIFSGVAKGSLLPMKTPKTVMDGTTPVGFNPDSGVFFCKHRMRQIKQVDYLILDSNCKGILGGARS